MRVKLASNHKFKNITLNLYKDLQLLKCGYMSTFLNVVNSVYMRDGEA